MRSKFIHYSLAAIVLLFPVCLLGQETLCGDGIDNDGDGLIDCYDPDCSGVAGCEDFFFGQPVPDCGYTPPELEEIELNLLFQTNEAQYPIDQRSGVFVGDMNGDGVPDLVSRDNSPARIQIFSGDDGRILQSIVTPQTHPFGQTAIADVDADGLGDIFQIEYTGVLARYEFGNPNAVWRTANNIGDDNVVSTPQLADINQDGIPEVYVGDRIFNALTGQRYVDGGNNVNVGGYAGGNNSDRFPIYFDLFQPGDPRPDGNGNFGPEAAGMEYIAGNQVWTVTFSPSGPADNGSYQLAAEYNNSASEGDGFTSIADINGDGRMDIAVMDGGRVYAWDPYTNQGIGAGFDVPNTNSGGRINIGDFDGDGDVELGFAGRDIYIVRNYTDNDGDANPNNGTWTDLWRRTGLDDGSQRTGSTLFDFDGNGTVEVVYSEEENLFIFDGPTGTELYRIQSRAGTRTEYPLVADVNGDGTAEIIVTAQALNGPQFSGAGWISVYESANQPWVPARQVWNQHGYNVTNVNDDLTIPQFQQNNLNPALGQRYNNFLVQTAVGGGPEAVILYPAPDAIINVQTGADGLPVIDFSSCPDEIVATLVIDNAGSAPLPASTPISYYINDPSMVAATLIQSTTLGTQVAAGAQVIVQVTIPISSVPAGARIYLSVNDPGFSMADLPFQESDFPLTGTPECIYTNNVSFLGNARCGEICGDGVDNDGDGLVDEPNLTQLKNTGCPGEVLPAITADVAGGTWSVVGGSSIGTTVDQNGVVTLGNNFTGAPVTETIRYDDGICVEDVSVTTVDLQAPAITCPGNATVAVDGNCTSSLSDYTTFAQVSDNCTAAGDLVLNQAPVAGSNLNLGENTVMISVTDENGNTANCTFVITAEDRIAPVPVCPAATDVPVNQNCQYVIPDLTNTATVTDNCSASGNITWAQTPVQGEVRSNDGTTVLVTLMATDEAGNTGNCTYTITLTDVIPPVINCPGPQVRDLSMNNCSLLVPDFRGQAGLADNCSPVNQITVSQSPAPGALLTSAGTTQVTLTATDAAGNATNCTFDLTTVDRTPPLVTCPGTIEVNADPVGCAGTVTDVTGQAQATDNCGSTGLVLMQAPAAGTTFSSTTQNVVVTATDAAGNSSQCTVVFRKRDVTPPTLNCPAPQTLVVDANNCLVALPDLTSNVASDACGGVSVTQQPGVGTNVSNDLVVTVMATDNVGLTSSCTVAIMVVDQTPPTVQCPATQTIAVDGTCAVPLPDYTGQASTSDNCDPRQGPVSVMQSPLAGQPYTINDSPVTVTLTATDASGNTGTCTFLVELMDNQPPQIACPVSPQIAELRENCTAVVPDFREETMVSSTCTMSGFSLVQVPAPGTIVSNEQVTVITITADDGQGNTVSCNFDFQTIDVTDPAIFCPDDQTVPLDENCTFEVPDYTGLAIIADNCSSLAPAPAPLISVTQNPAPGTVLSGDGTVTQILLTATDAAGNTASCSFNLTTEDITSPDLVCPGNQTESVDAGCNFLIPDYTTLVAATDNCSSGSAVLYAQSPAAGTVISGAGTTTSITVTGTDEAGNSTTCSFLLILEDETDPAITCPQPRTIAVDASCMAVVPSLVGAATATDNCQGGSPILITQDVPAGTTLSGDGTTQVVTLTADDGNGNTSTCTVLLTLDDTTDPAVTCPAAQEVNLAATGCEVAIPDFRSQLTLSDNCTAAAALTVQQMPAPGTILSGANTVQTVTFAINDQHGNNATCSFDLTLTDVTDPVITCPAPAALLLDADCSAALPDFTGLVAYADDCSMLAPGGSGTLVQSPSAGTRLTFDGAQTMVTISASDGNGNTSSCTFTVTAEDQEAPMVVCPADRVAPVSGNCDFEVPDYTGELSVLDNCSETAAIMVTQLPVAGTLIPESQLGVPQTITLIATDAAGNSRQCTFLSTPIDVTPPSIVCPAAQTIVLDPISCEVPLGDYTALATLADNCTDPAMLTVTQDIAPTTVYNGLVPGQVMLALTATDAAGNTASCNVTVFIEDQTDPSIDCAAANQTIALDENCNGRIPDLIPDLITGDNCSATALTVLQSPAAGAEYGGDGTVVPVTFTVTDPSGNAVTCTATITFTDQSPPNPVICPVDQELNVDDVCAVPLPDYTNGATVLDNCRAQADIVITQVPAPGTMVSIAGTVINVVLTADDGNGNTATCAFDVTLVDENALDITCPGGQIVIASSADCDGELEDYSSLVTAVNQCMSPAAGVTYQQVPGAGTLLERADLDIPQTVTITALDLNGNPSSCTFLVTLVDTLAPVLVCPPSQSLHFDGSCQFLVPDFRDEAMITDNCADRNDLVITQDPAPGAPLAGTFARQMITITATDPSGNQGQCQFELTVSDNLPPLLICPAPDTISTDNECLATLGDYTGTAFADDGCTPRDQIVLEQIPPPGTILSGHLTTQTISIRATDEYGNMATCEFTVTTVDEVAPTVLCPGNQVVRPDDNCTATLPDYRPVVRSFDNCTAGAAISLTQLPPAGTTLTGEGTTLTVTILAEDENGNVDSCKFQVAVADNTPPVITCPADKTVALDDDCTYDLENLVTQATVVDNCTLPANITTTQNIGVGQTFSGDQTEVVVVLTANDGNGNSAQCSTRITLEDTTDPTITCPDDQVVFLDTGCAARVPDFRMATVADNCTPPAAITVTQALAPGTVLTGHAVTEVITLTANDGNGNTATCSFNLTLRDNTAPIITCPPAQEIVVGENCEAVLPDYLGLATASDNCAPAPALAQNIPAGTVLSGLGPRTVTLTADDGNGNTATCDFVVNVRDVTPPQLTCPPLSLIAANAACEVVLADYRDSIMVTDNCGPASGEMGALTLVQNPLPGAVLAGLGANQNVVVTATDPSGNSTQCNINVELVDTTRPTIVCPADTTLAVGNDCAVLIPDYTDLAVVMDNCAPPSAAGVTVTQSPVPGAQASDEMNLLTITLTATDASGNSMSCDFAVQLIDTLPPRVICPENDVISVDGNCPVMLPDYRPAAGASDNCSNPAAITLTQRPAPGTELSGDGTVQEVTIIATDESGNQDSCSLLVTLEDSTDPMITCPANQQLTANEDCLASIPDYATGALASSACEQSSITISQSPPAGTQISGHNSTETITLTATDGSGNSASCSFEVVLLDRTAPEIVVCQNDTIGRLSPDCNYTVPDYWSIGPATATDNCRPTGSTSTAATGDQINYSQIPPPGTVLTGPLTTTTITLTADDGNGNSTSCDFTLTLTDQTSPVIACPADTVANPDADCNFSLEDYTARAMVSDNCASVASLVLTQLPVAGTVINGQATSQEVTLSVADPSGNVSSCSFNLLLQDAQAPSISCPTDKVENLTATCAFIVPDYTGEAIVADNCSAAAVISVTQDPVPGTLLPNQQEGDTFTVTLTADDGNGNAATCAFLVTLDDVTLPTITCPPAPTIFVDGSCMAPLPDLVPLTIVTDNCSDGSVISVTQSPAPATVYAGDDTQVSVTLVADDGNGNNNQCVVTVTLQDTIRPLLTCPDNEVLLADENCTVRVPDYRVQAVIMDNCTATGEITVRQDVPPATVLSGEGTSQVVTLTADDGNGNTTSCTLEVTVEDQLPPQIVCPTTQTQYLDGACDVMIDDYRSLSLVSDNCTEATSVSILQDPAPGTLFNGVQNRIVMLTAADESGNTTTCEFTFLLRDTTAPALTCPAAQEVSADENCTAVIGDYTGLATVMDNCSTAGDLAGNGISVLQTPAAGTTLTGFNQERTVSLTARDSSGNFTTCTFQVALLDEVVPTIVCPSAQEIDVGEDCRFSVPDYRSLAITEDNCGPGMLTLTQSPGIDSVLTDLGTQVDVRLTVTDASGNTANCTFSVTTASPTPPPAATTVTLAVTGRPTGSGTVNLQDAFDDMAPSNLSNLDLDQQSDPAVGPYVVTYYLSRSDADAEENAIPNENYDPLVSGQAVLVRIEDPVTGCFTLSQILLDVREPGRSNAADSVFCAKPAANLKIDGLPVPGRQGAVIVRHQWRLLSGGATRIQPSDLMNTEEQIVMIATNGLRQGEISLEYQFFEDYGDGPVVPSVPKVITVTILPVGTGDFFWDGN